MCLPDGSLIRLGTQAAMIHSSNMCLPDASLLRLGAHGSNYSLIKHVFSSRLRYIQS
jgi:hypothetical protein